MKTKSQVQHNSCPKGVYISGGDDYYAKNEKKKKKWRNRSSKTLSKLLFLQ